MSLRWENVLAWRLRRQGLAERAPAAAWPEVISRICGLHAQVMSSAELTLWARAMRGTLHLLPAGELSAYGRPRRSGSPRSSAASSS